MLTGCAGLARHCRFCCQPTVLALDQSAVIAENAKSIVKYESGHDLHTFVSSWQPISAASVQANLASHGSMIVSI
jgi:hypothetical protein